MVIMRVVISSLARLRKFLSQHKSAVTPLIQTSAGVRELSAPRPSDSTSELAEGDATDDAAARPRRLDLGLWSEHLDILVVLRKSTDFGRKGWAAPFTKRPGFSHRIVLLGGNTCCQRSNAWKSGRPSNAMPPTRRSPTVATCCPAKLASQRGRSTTSATHSAAYRRSPISSEATWAWRMRCCVGAALMPQSPESPPSVASLNSAVSRSPTANATAVAVAALRQSAQLVVTPPPALSGPSMDDLIRRNRALLAMAAAACALHRRIAAMASTVRAEGERLRRHAETIGRQLHVQPVGLT
jgi:hypothetical protein